MQNILIKTKKYALSIIGGLSDPSKMPGMGWSIPAAECKRGSKLRKIKNTSCYDCYACKGRYVFPNVQKSLYKRLKSIHHPEWKDAMIFLLKNEKYFRWFDSGDLQDWTMLKQIADVCEKTPNCKHWLPTREFSIVKQYIKKGFTIPDNLTIRLSSDIIDQLPKHMISGIPFSTISRKKDTFPNADNCMVSMEKEIKTCDQANGCRKCWDKNVLHINYKKH